MSHIFWGGRLNKIQKETCTSETNQCWTFTAYQSLHKSSTMCLLALQQYIHESPWGSQINDSSPRDALVCSKQEQAGVMSFLNSSKWKTCCVTPFFFFFFWSALCESFSIYRCSLLHYLSPLGDLHDKVSAKRFGPVTQMHLWALHNYPGPVCGWWKMHFGWYMLFRHDTNSQQHKQGGRRKVPDAQIAKVPLIKVAD